MKLKDSTWLILLLFAFYFLQTCNKAKDKKAILISTKLQFTNKHIICNNNTIYWSSSASNISMPKSLPDILEHIWLESKKKKTLDKLAT